MAKKKDKKRGLLVGEIRIQRRIGKDGEIVTLCRSSNGAGEPLEYFEMAGMMAISEKHLYAQYDYEAED